MPVISYVCRVFINDKRFLSMINQVSNTRENSFEGCFTGSFQTGDKEFFSNLYDIYVNALFTYGCKITSDYELLKDCIHDVFVKIYNKRRDLNNVLNFESYLFVSLRNKLFDELRKKKLLSEKQVEDYYPVATENVEADYIVREKENLSNKKVSQLLDQLSARQKEAITLYYLEEKKYEDICVIMDINYQSLRNLIHRGLTKLRMVTQTNHDSGCIIKACTPPQQHEAKCG